MRAGAWRLEVMPEGSVRAADCLRRIELGDADAAELGALVAAEARAAAGRLSPSAGAMVQAVWFDGGQSVPGGCC